MSARKVSRMEHVSEKADLARRSIPLTVTKGLFPESEMSAVSGESRGMNRTVHPPCWVWVLLGGFSVFTFRQ